MMLRPASSRRRHDSMVIVRTTTKFYFASQKDLENKHFEKTVSVNACD